MTHVHALATLCGLPESAPLVDHGIAALTGPLHDHAHGGWFLAVDADGSPLPRKEAYTHAFVVLAASSALAADRAGADDLLSAALDVVEQRFWEEEAGRVAESFAQDWSEPEPYRGANSNMHTVEALLAAGDVLGDARLRDRALTIATHLIDQVARAHGWRVVEHFDRAWREDLAFNRDTPAHPFRPYGTTVGHWLEWARLLLHLEAASDAPPSWLQPAAIELFRAAVEVGWAADGSPGFVYTLGWDDEPVVRTRMHWVVAEAIAAASALHERTEHPVYEAWYRALWDHAARLFIDRRDGSWHHELSPSLRPAAAAWRGKPDLYHAVQATLLPQLQLAPSLAAQLAG